MAVGQTHMASGVPPPNARQGRDQGCCCDMETFQAAIQTVFNPASDPSHQQQANQWLNSFAATPEAWDASLAVLDSQSPGEVLFFAANVLVNKSRTDWGKLAPERRAHLQHAVSTKLQQGLASGSDSPLLHRLCLALTAMAVRGGPQAAADLAGQALGLAAQSQAPHVLRCALVMLTELHTEAGALDTGRATAVQAAIKPFSGQVLSLMQTVMTTTQPATGVLPDALKCLQAWSHDLTGMGSPLITVTQLHAEYPGLFSTLFHLMASEDTSSGAAGLLSALFSVAPADPSGPSGAPWRAAAVSAVSHLAALRPQAARPGKPGAETAWGVARCGTALSDACAEFAAGALPADGVADVAGAALQLAEVMITCLGRPERVVADSVVDYLINLNTIPVAKRIPQLQVDVYASALPVLLGQAQYPNRFTCWEDEEEDEGTFTRFRDHQLCELLETTYAMLGTGYLVVVQQAFTNASTWEAFEASLYAVRAVNMPLKMAMLGRDRADPSLDPRSAELLGQAAQVSALLMSLTNTLCAPPAGSAAQRFLGTSAWALKEACRLVGEYAAWFGKAHILAAAVAAAAPGAAALNAALGSEAPLDGALRLTLAGMADPVSRHEGAQAFRNLCVRSAARLSSSDSLPGVVNAALQVIAPDPETSLATLPAGTPGRRTPQHSAGGTPQSATRDRELVVEGLGRLVSGMEVGAMAAAGIMLTQPLVARAQAFAQAGTTTRPAALQLLADDLTLLAAAIRFMDFPGNAPAGMTHPALTVLEGAWPVLSGVAQNEACRREPEVVAALCDVYQRSLMSARAASKELLPALITSVTAILTSHPHPGCCNLLGTAVELFGEARSAPQVAQMQATALETVGGAVIAAVQAQSGSRSQPELIKALYDMADLYFVFARETLLSSPALQQLISFGCVVVGLREREPVAAALAFLMHVLGVVEKLTGDLAADHRARLEACMTAHGATLMRSLLMAVSDSCPRQLARPLSGLLYVLLYSGVWGQAARAWLSSALQGPEFAGVASSALSSEEVGRVYALMTRQPALGRGRFDAFIGDLSGVIRGEAQADVLLAYEM